MLKTDCLCLADVNNLFIFITQIQGMKPVWQAEHKLT